MPDYKKSYLIAYDIVDDNRRSHVAKALQSYGERLQYSVFLLEVRPAQMIRVRQQLESEMDPQDNSIIVCPLGNSARAAQEIQFLGRHSYEDVAIPTVI